MASMGQIQGICLLADFHYDLPPVTELIFGR